jgi:hypothetical protein
VGIGWQAVALDAQSFAAAAGRPAAELTRRDVARGLLAVSSSDALAVLPALRRELIGAGNPLSAVFWDSAAATLGKIADRSATVGEVEDWVEATGTEPASMIGMLVWADEVDRGPLESEVYGLLVAHLEGLVADGLIDPDALVTGGSAALSEHRRLQEAWLMAPLPDGRIPMWLVLDEEDEQFSAEWDAAEAEALAELREVLAELPDRPVPEADLRAACSRIRATMRQGAWPSDLLAACGGVSQRSLPGDDADLWLTLAAGLVSPEDELPRARADQGDPGDDGDLSEDEQAMVALCALEHYDWLAVTCALAEGGPGTPADGAELGRYVAEYDPDDDDDDDEADATGAMFVPAVGLWRVLGAIDDDDRLTALGWWGIPEATQRAWQPRS